MNNIYSSSYFGSKVTVYPNRVEWTFPGNGTKSIPISQIASVSSAMMGVMKVTIETTGGQRFHIATHKKKELVDAINSVLSPQAVSQEVVAIQSKNTSSDTPWYMWIVFLVFWPISLSYWVIKKSNWSRRGKAVAILAILILAVAIHSKSSSTPSQVADQNTGQSLEDASSSASILQPDANSVSDLMLTSEELGYLDQAIRINKNVVDAMQAISSMSDNPIAIYTNDEMRSHVAAGMIIVQMSYQDAKKLTPPDSFSTVHAPFLEGLRMHNDGIDVLVEAIDEVDAEKMLKATSMISDGADQYSLAAQALLNLSL